jgi:soluble lytic murein transglycosylase-like protein
VVRRIRRLFRAPLREVRVRCLVSDLKDSCRGNRTRPAEALGVPVNLALAVARYESGGRCGMRGRAGERGAMQVLPQTARSVGVTGNLYDCATGIEAGLRYLRLAMMMHAQARWCAVASAYNHGTWHGSSCTRHGRLVAFTAGMR